MEGMELSPADQWIIGGIGVALALVFGMIHRMLAAGNAETRALLREHVGTQSALEQAIAQRIDQIAAVIEVHGQRIVSLETRVAQSPTREDVLQIERRLADLAGDLKSHAALWPEFRRTIDRQQHITDLLTQFLSERERAK